MVDVEQVIRTYKGRVRKNDRLRDLAKNAKDFAQANAYAKGTGDELAMALYTSGTGNMSQDELTELLTACLRQNHGDVARVCRRVQRLINDNAGLAIGVLVPEYDSATAARIAEELAGSLARNGEISLDQLRNLVTKESQGVVDDSIKRNFEAADNMGLSVKITRRYDEVGLREGTKWAERCEWCLAREGVWDSVAEAREAGAFERHPGCGCVITYEVHKTRKWSGMAGRWEDL